jgi:seryl-tRNA synthetase
MNAKEIKINQHDYEMKQKESQIEDLTLKLKQKKVELQSTSKRIQNLSAKQVKKPQDTQSARSVEINDLKNWRESVDYTNLNVTPFNHSLIDRRSSLRNLVTKITKRSDDSGGSKTPEI